MSFTTRILRGLAGAAMVFAASAGAGAAERAPSLKDMVRAVERVPIEEGSSAVGTGFFISPSHVLTSAHVLVGCRAFVVSNDRIGTLNARLKASEYSRDSAVLFVQGRTPHHLGLARLAAPQRGEPMTIVGFPADRAGGRRPVTYPATFHAARSDEAGIPVLELASDIVAGASGAPVLDRNDKLAGIVVGRLDKPPRDVVALSLAGLSGRMLGFFAEAESIGGKEAGDMADETTPDDAVVKIRCR